MAQKFDWLKHAFAVNPHGSPPTDEQRQLVEQLAREIVRRRLTMPALAFLEMSRPLNFLGAQAMHFFAPIVTTLFDGPTYEQFAKFLERRDSIDLLCDAIENAESAASTPPKEPEPDQ
ncbi:hypothetical protein [Planctomicrobium piriforme]|uniref:Uncharacterized protein n=1 Tax=Planctomicrobium piriforme TaxID=1576369 RepID=A0A1I3JSU9_9PLAN|nr:hypothetical protein [Planctomicrobium piriforme]SFI63349.1 hypothetical protein SAMN05421753_1112 [Planctomicrobium piriforme]